MHGNSFKVLKLYSLPSITISIHLISSTSHDHTEIMNFQRLIFRKLWWRGRRPFRIWKDPGKGNALTFTQGVVDFTWVH